MKAMYNPVVLAAQTFIWTGWTGTSKVLLQPWRPTTDVAASGARVVGPKEGFAAFGTCEMSLRAPASQGDTSITKKAQKMDTGMVRNWAQQKDIGMVMSRD